MTDPAVPAPAPPRAPTQPGIGAVLTPKWRSALARSRESERGRGARLLLFAVIAAVFWSAAFGISYRVLGYISTQEIGTLLASKMLGVILLAFAAILLLSNLITALSSYFLAKDLDLLVAAPLHWFRLYVAKLIETAAHSSWMVGLIALPIFTAYGIVFEGGVLFPFVALAAFIPFIILPAVIGSAVTLVLVNVFPARRARDLLSLVAIGAVGGAVLVLRLMRPEQLVRPEGFQSLVEFIGVLRAPTNPFLPTEWASDMIMNWLTHVADPLPITLLYTTAAAFVIMGGWLHGRLFRDGYSKSQEGAERFVRGRRFERAADLLLGRMAPARREFLLKDLRLFFRDPTQWSQLILLGVLLVVYLFNIRSLPLFSGERVPFFLVTVIVFLNLGLAGFVLSAIAARFVFPAVSLEGRQMWLIHSSPVDFRTLLWSKYWLGTLPLIVLAVFITAATNVLLRASAFMMLVSVGTLVLFTFAASAMALCLGAYYPKFDTENAAQIPTSFGGLVFMMSSISLLGLLIAIEAVPIGAYLRAHQAGGALAVTPGLIGAGMAVFGTCALATIIPLRLALRRLETMEWSHPPFSLPRRVKPVAAPAAAGSTLGPQHRARSCGRARHTQGGSMARSSILPLLALAAACGGDAFPTGPTGGSAPRTLHSAALPAPAREAVARRLARALADPGFRTHLRAQLDTSTHPEGKVRLADLLAASGGRGLRALAAVEQRAVPAPERQAAEHIEVYLPVAGHRAAWRGGGNLLVGTIGADGEVPVAFDLRGRRVAIDSAAPPATPVLAVVPLESDLGPARAARAALAAACVTNCSGETVGASGSLYLTASHLRESFESWLKGKPEIELLVLGQKGASDSLTSYQCGGEQAAGAYRFDQNSLDWSGSALVMSRAQLDAYEAQHPGKALRLFFMEDDDTPCQIRANNADLRQLITTVDSLVRGYAGGKDVPGGLGSVYRNFSIAQKIYAVAASAIKSNDDLIGNAVEDVTTTERYAGYNWIIKGEDGRTNGYVKLEMR